MAQQEARISSGWIWGGAVVVAALAVVFVVRSQQSAVPVKTARVERRDLIQPVSTNGNVEPM